MFLYTPQVYTYRHYSDIWLQKWTVSIKVIVKFSSYFLTVTLIVCGIDNYEIQWPADWLTCIKYWHLLSNSSFYQMTIQPSSVLRGKTQHYRKKQYKKQVIESGEMKTEMKYENEKKYFEFAFFSTCPEEIFCSSGVIQINSIMKRLFSLAVRHYASISALPNPGSRGVPAFQKEGVFIIDRCFVSRERLLSVSMLLINLYLL